MADRRSRSCTLSMDPSLLFIPLGYRSTSVGGHLSRGRSRRPRHHYVNGVRTQLIGADSYPNPTHSPCRLILCGPTGSFQKVTRCSSTFELSRTGVYCSREDLRPGKKNNNSSSSSSSDIKTLDQQRKATSCEDVFRATTTTAMTKNTTAATPITTSAAAGAGILTTTTGGGWDSRLSESGVSLNDSRTDLGSSCCPEDVEVASQCSFGSSAFHEMTGDSEMDRPDSDCLSVPGAGYYGSRDAWDPSRTRRRERSGGGGLGGGSGAQGKARHDSGSREKFLADLTASSGRSSPSREEDKEFYHSTPTKRGSPVLSIFPGDEEDLHFSSPKDPFHGGPLLTHGSVDSLLSPSGYSSSSSHPHHHHHHHLPNDSLPDSAIELSTESLPMSPKRAADRRPKTKRTGGRDEGGEGGTSSVSESLDDDEDEESSSWLAVREALRRRRLQFFASFSAQGGDPSPLERQHSAGESVQSWLTTGHPQRHVTSSPPPYPPFSSSAASTISSSIALGDRAHDDTTPDQQQQEQRQQGQYHGEGGTKPTQSSPPSVKRRLSMRELVREIEQDLDCQPSTPDNSNTAISSSSSTTLMKQTGAETEGPQNNGLQGAAADSTSRQAQQLSVIQQGEAERGGASSLLQQQQLCPHSPSIPASAQITSSLLNSATDPPRIPAGGEGGKKEEEEEKKNDALSSSHSFTITTTTTTPSSLTLNGFNNNTEEASFPDGQNSTSLSLAFGDELSPESSDRRLRRVGGGESVITVLGTRGEEEKKEEEEEEEGEEEGRRKKRREEDSETRLRAINAGPVTTSADGLPGADYLAVSGDDRTANTGAPSNSQQATQRRVLLSADAAVTELISTAPDSCLPDDGDSVVNVPGQSHTRSRDDSRTEKDGKREGGSGGTESQKGQEQEDSSSLHLYHARPIQIVPRGGGDAGGDGDDDGEDDAEVMSVLSASAAAVPSQDEEETLADDIIMGSQCEPPLQAGVARDSEASVMRVVRVQEEVSQRLERHVHHRRTTVQETVTTRRTSVRHGPGSPPPVGGSRAAEEEEEGDSARDDSRDFEMTDRTVSRVTLTEHGSEREETVTRTTTTTSRPQESALVLVPDSRSPLTSTLTTHHAGETTTTLEGHRMPSSVFTDVGHAQIQATTGRGQAQCENRILDDLQEQLSELASFEFEDGALTTSSTFLQHGDYKDHAEASLPQTEPAGGDGMSRGTVSGTGSVFFTLDRAALTRVPDGSEDAPAVHTTDGGGVGITTSDWRKDDVLPGQGSETSSLHHARAIQIQPGGVEEEKVRPSAPFSHQSAASSLWSLAGSSSEINDSDDRCTSLSSHRHPYTDSDGDSRREEDDRGTGRKFQDLISGLQGPLPSDQPSLHRSLDTMEEEFSALLPSSFVQETILEADDENESTDEEVGVPVIHSFKSSLHFCVPEASNATPTTATTTSTVLAVSSVPELKRQEKMMCTTATEDKADTLSSQHSLQDLSHRLSGISDVSRGLRRSDDSYSVDDQGPSVSHPILSGTGEAASANSSSSSAKARRVLAPQISVESVSSSRRSSLTLRGSRKAQWVQEKLLLFQKLLNDFETQRKTTEQRVMEEMMTADKGRVREDGGTGLENQSEFCDDLYRLFSREHLERRQSHVCPVIEDHLPAFRFRRFLRKKHNSKLKGHTTFRLPHRLEGLREPSSQDDTTQEEEGRHRQQQAAVSDDDDDLGVPVVSRSKTRNPPYHIHPAHRTLLTPGSKLRSRYASDVFLTDPADADADVNRSVSSDSAYSSLSGTLSSSRNLSDLESTFRSVTGSVAADVSMGDEAKMRSLSDVFDHTGLHEGDVDEARLLRLQVGHTKAETL